MKTPLQCSSRKYEKERLGKLMSITLEITKDYILNKIQLTL